MRTRVTALKINKKSKESLFVGRFLNATVKKKKKRGGYRRGERHQRKRGRAEERRKKA